MGSYLTRQISWLNYAFLQLITQKYSSVRAIRPWENLSTEELIFKKEASTNLTTLGIAQLKSIGNLKARNKWRQPEMNYLKICCVLNQV